MNFKNTIRRVLGKLLSIFVVMMSNLLCSHGRIFMLHSIGDNRHPFNLSLDAFERLLQKLKDCNVARLEEWERNDDFVCLTFDDVADSFYYNAFPLLKKYNIPFTIFISCSLLDTELYLTTDMLKNIALCDLCTVGSHGWDHCFFSDYNRAEAENDLLSSKRHLEKITGRKIEVYAFPYGSFFACGYTKKNIVKKYYRYGFASMATPLTKPSLMPNYYLPRIGITDKNIENIIKGL